MTFEIWSILCLWFRSSLIYIKNCPTRCITKQSIYYSASSLYMFRVSTTPIVRSTQNCNYSLRYWSYFLCSYLPPTWPSWPRWREVAVQKIWSVPEAVVTVLCTPGDRCVYSRMYKNLWLVMVVTWRDADRPIQFGYPCICLWLVKWHLLTTLSPFSLGKFWVNR